MCYFDFFAAAKIAFLSQLGKTLYIYPFYKLFLDYSNVIYKKIQQKQIIYKYLLDNQTNVKTSTIIIIFLIYHILYMRLNSIFIYYIFEHSLYTLHWLYSSSKRFHQIVV